MEFFKKIALFSVFLLFLQGCGQTGAAPAAPDFRVEDLDGGQISLNQYRGKVVILEFWSVSCQACQMSMPELSDLQTKYQSQGLSVIGITIDHPQRVNNELLKEFRKYFKVNFKFGRANNQVIQDYFAGQFRLALPTIFIIDRKGNIVQKYDGYAQGELEKAVKPHL